MVNEDVHRFQMKELRGRSRVFLDRRLLPLLQTALEFAEMDPPRMNVVMERLEMMKAEMKSEIDWLRRKNEQK